MAKTIPIHSEKQDVYHDNDRCTERNNIEPINLRHGTGFKRQCKRCKELNSLLIDLYK